MYNILCKPTITNLATLRIIDGIYSLYESRKFFSRIKTIIICNIRRTARTKKFVSSRIPSYNHLRQKPAR
jgi:hypothetical protein